MYQIILLIHVIIALFLIGLVLIQQGKGASAGASFGSGASGTVFGSQGSGSFLMRLTAGLAAGFFATSIILGYMASAMYKTSQQIDVIGSPMSQSAPLTLPGEHNPQ